MISLLQGEEHLEDYDTEQGVSVIIKERGEGYKSYLALFKVSSSIIVNEHEAQIVSGGEFLVDIFECWS